MSVSDFVVSPMLLALLTRKLETIEKIEIAIELSSTASRVSSIGMLAVRLQIGPGILREIVAEMERDRLVVVTGDDVRLTCDGAESDLIAEAATMFADSRPEMLRLFARIARERGQQLALRVADDTMWLRARKNRVE